MFTNWHQAEGIFSLLKTIPAVAGREGTSCTIQAWNKAWNSGESNIKSDGITQKNKQNKKVTYKLLLEKLFEKSKAEKIKEKKYWTVLSFLILQPWCMKH